MHTVELLQHALALAETLGYGIRHEWLGGATGGLCEIAGKRWLFVDLALNPIEQFDQVVTVLQQDPRIHSAEMLPALRHHLGLQRAA